MWLLQPLEPSFAIQHQITLKVSPVVIVNTFTFNKADEKGFLKIWAANAALLSNNHNPAVYRPHWLQKVGVNGICVA